MMRRWNYRGLVVIGALLTTAGCGVDIMVTAPSVAPAGQTQSIQLKVTNISACPLVNIEGGLGADLLLAPYVPASAVEESPLLLFCELGNAPPAYTASASLSGAEQAATAAAAREQVMQIIAAAGATATTCSGSGVVCGTDAEEAGSSVGCVLPPLAPGAMASLDCQATVPVTSTGKVYTLAFVNLIAAGVCKAGVGQGAACADDAACGVTGVCGDGICQGGMNAGNGCDDSSECGLQGTCVLCDQNTGFGFGCAEAEVVALPPAPAPAAAPWALGVGLAALLTVAAGQLYRRSAR